MHARYVSFKAIDRTQFSHNFNLKHVPVADAVMFLLVGNLDHRAFLWLNDTF